MKLNQTDKPVLIALAVGALLSGAIVVLEGFKATMSTLWLLSFMLFVIFACAKYGFGIGGFPLRFLIERGAENGLTEKEVYDRGMWVSFALMTTIPFLWQWAS